MRERIKNMKVKSKLNLYGYSMVFLMIVMGIVSLYQSKSMQDRTREITEVWSPSVALVQEMDTLTSDYRMKQYGHLVATTESKYAEYESQLSSIDSELAAVRASFEKIMTLDEEKKLYENIVTKWNNYVKQSQVIIDMSRAGKVEEGGELMVGELLNTFEDFQSSFQQLITLETDALNHAKDMAHSTYTTMIWSLIIAMAAAVILAAILANYINNLIADPIKQITEASEKMRQGDMSGGQLITYKSKDELGIVASSLRGSMRILESYIQEISSTLREMAKGDLTKDGSEITDFLGDFESIKESLIYILKHFNATLADIQRTSEQVSSNAEQIAGSSQDLSNGATEQASSIEEVTAELTEVVRSSEDSAAATQTAYENVKASVANAENGKLRMEELTEEMKRIMEISKKIENISTTIEDIASQTNILSLNASVEAARAGEAGKGFAVVAEQIGKLASDSAQSAVSTRELIGRALEEIKKGNEITSATSEAFGTMIDDMQGFAETARKTNENAKREADSLEQVEHQIDLISGEIQNTAATSEESAAISEQLSEEAQHLEELVKRFKLF